MPVPGRRSPGATRAPLGACALLPRRGPARSRPARSPPTHPGSHRSPIPARARVTPTTAGWRCASTCAPSSRHLRPRGPRAPGPADSLSPEVPPSPPRDGPPSPAELRTRTPAVLDGPAPPARAPRPRRGYCCPPRPRAQPHDPSPPRRAGEICRAAAAAAAAAAHYHRPARAAAALKRRRQPHRRRPATGPVTDPYHRFERN
ncbi:vegetative cell wall protein gp1-like [Ursus americanus]|uniref:vegetative cell wall protein gp1-like n=1 Tax=Ursus americanus TaxID=9643 RepID=UPI001E67D8C9|nr:vegetative cell wall protein gp1-like [Ursus americanus]